jgi:hypothetical protein
MSTTRNPTPVIVGAGLAGLIAAHAWPTARVLEAAPQPVSAHKALLRFRSDVVANLVGVDFRKVRVRKGIWWDSAFVAPDIRVANMYAQKVTGSLSGDRSIWNLDPVDRYIAPDDLHERMLDAVGRRVEWGRNVNFAAMQGVPVVNTAPLPVVLRSLDLSMPETTKFDRAAITVRRWKVPSCDVFQTIYFPDPTFGVYRASLTGDTLIAEFVHTPDAPSNEREITAAFGFWPGELSDWEELPRVEQKYGKIQPLPEQQRKALLFRLTHEHNIFSLGRFGTWRNCLLDDVVHDISVIKRLLRDGSAYDMHKELK